MFATPHSVRRILLLLMLGCALTACNAVDESRLSTSGNNLDPSYERLASTASATSTLGGVALKLRPIPTATTLSASSGTLDHESGATTINDGTYTLIDPDGYTQNGLLTDGVSTLFSTPAQGFTGNYDYARVYSHAYFVNTVPFVTTGVYGVVTREEDMPSTGTATYTGEAQASYFNTTSNFDLSDGTSEIKADFAAGTVDVTTDKFDITNRETGVSANVGFNAVKITGMTVFGNQFSGGTITTELNGRKVEIVTDRAQESALGRFFGLTTSGRPDEAGGIGYLRGNDGSLTTIFLAD